MQFNTRRTFNHEFPYVELSLIGFFIFCIGLSVIQFFKSGEIDYLYIIVVLPILIILTVWITNWRNKKLYFNNDHLTIISFFGSAKNFPYNSFKGYILKETYQRTGTGLDYHVHLILNNNKRINLIKEVHPDYDKLPATLNKFGVDYIGKEEIQSKNKHIYAKVGIYASIIAIILFLLVQLLKIAQ